MGKKLLDNYVEGNQLIHQYTANASDNVLQNKKHDNYSEDNFYYERDSIAAYLASDPEMFEYNFYGVTNSIFEDCKNQDAIDNINAIIHYYDSMVDEEYQLNQDVEHYYKEMGFVNDEGYISTNKYKEYIIFKARVDNQVKELDERKTL